MTGCWLTETPSMIHWQGTYCQGKAIRATSVAERIDNAVQKRGTASHKKFILTDAITRWAVVEGLQMGT